jgi:hypothetical protein
MKGEAIARQLGPAVSYIITARCFSKNLKIQERSRQSALSYTAVTVSLQLQLRLELKFKISGQFWYSLN